MAEYECEGRTCGQVYDHSRKETILILFVTTTVSSSHVGTGSVPLFTVTIKHRRSVQRTLKECSENTEGMFREH